jgi:hypothetical protein
MFAAALTMVVLSVCEKESSDALWQENGETVKI